MITLGPPSPFLKRSVALSNRLIEVAQAEGYAPGEMGMAANLIVMRLIEANEASKASVFFEPRTVHDEEEPAAQPSPSVCAHRLEGIAPLTSGLCTACGVQVALARDGTLVAQMTRTRWPTCSHCGIPVLQTEHDHCSSCGSFRRTGEAP